jgi:hypothetical protein
MTLEYVLIIFVTAKYVTYPHNRVHSLC